MTPCAARVLSSRTIRTSRELVARYLDKAGFTTERVASGRDALRRDRRRAARPARARPDAAAGRRPRSLPAACAPNDATAAIPIIMLTARAEESERIVGLELGADDYLAKPFSPNELVARVRALLRRAQRGAGRRPRTLALRTDRRRSRERHTVSSDGRDVTLTAKEFLLLEYLLQHRGRVLSRDVLLTDVWGYRYTGGTRTVDVHVRRLREKLPLLADGARHGQAVRLQAGRAGAEAMMRAAPVPDASCSSPRSSAALIALAVAGAARSRRRCGGRPTRGSRTTLVAEARLAAELLGARHAAGAHRPRSSTRKPTGSAQLLGARVTLHRGRRPRASATRRRRSTASPRWRTTARGPRSSRRARSGLGRARRYSATLKIDMLYVAVPVRHPAIAFVRVALPLTDVRQQLQRGLTATLTALGLALLGGAAIAWIVLRRASASASAPIADVARALSRRRPHAAAPRLRRRRARRRGAGAGRLGAGARPPARRAGARSRAHGSDPRRHDRRRHRRRSAGAAAARQRRGAADAEARRRWRSAGPTSKRSAIRRSPSCVAAALAGATPGRAAAVAAARRRRARSWRARRRRPAAPRTAPSSCCTTSPTCGAPIRSAATSSPTSRTSCARR